MQRTNLWGGDMATAEEDSTWDDSELLELFDAAVKTHRRRGQQGRKRDRDSTEDKYLSFYDEDASTRTESQNSKKVAFDIPENTEGAKDSGDTSYDRIDKIYNSVYGNHASVQEAAATTELPPMADGGSAINSALSDMLYAWYQSGYMTGRYQTLLELQNRSMQSPSVSAQYSAEADA